MTNGGDRGRHSLPTLELDCDGSPVVVEADDVVVGRTAKCTVRVVHPLVSREHCRLEPRADGLYVIDLGSINGTWLNGKRVDGRALVRADDRVGLGREGAVLIVRRALVGGVDVTRDARQEDVQTLHAGDVRAAGAVARVEVASDAVPRAEPPTAAVPVVAALQTAEIPRLFDADQTVGDLPRVAPAPRGFAPGFAVGFALGLAAIGCLATFTHALDPIRPASREAGGK